jgi:hypothetical protein
MADTTEVRAEDLFPVRSRVGWGAIFAGAVVALALYLLLSLLGAAIGLSVSDQMRSDQLGSGAAIWAILSTLIALFVGGFVTTQCTAGENKSEAILYGIILWGVLIAMLLWLMATGVRMGFNAMMGVTTTAAANRDAISAMSQADWDRVGRQAGLTDEQIRQLRAAAADPAAEVRRAAEDPRIPGIATSTAWWAFGGTLLSILAAVFGAIVGAGPSPLLRGIAVRATRTTVSGTGTAFPTR